MLWATQQWQAEAPRTPYAHCQWKQSSHQRKGAPGQRRRGPTGRRGEGASVRLCWWTQCSHPPRGAPPQHRFARTQPRGKGACCPTARAGAGTPVTAGRGIGPVRDPTRVLASTFAPDSIRNSTIGAWPSAAAQRRGVRPPCTTMATQRQPLPASAQPTALTMSAFSSRAPWRSSKLAMSRSPR